MKWSLSDSLLEFFQTHHILELEELIPSEKADALLEKIESLCPSGSWEEGRDLWYRDSLFKKTLTSLQIGEIAAFLFKKRPIRLAYTAFLHPMQNAPFSSPKTLREISCMDPILGGVLLTLSGAEQSLPSPLPLFHQQAKGQCLFFSADYPIPFPELFTSGAQKSLLLTLSPLSTRYKLNPQDPCTHILKKQGYAFGDLIREETIPLLYL